MENNLLTTEHKNYIWRLRCLPVALLLLICAVITCPTPAQCEPQSWQLDQTHCFLSRCQLTLSKSGIRLESKDRLGFVLVSSAPDWRVTVYRNDDKTYFTDSYKQFCDTGMISGFIMKVAPRTIDPSEAPVLKTKLLGYEVNSLVSQKDSLKYMNLGDVAPQAEHILQAAYKMPTNGGIPLDYTKRYNSRDFFSGIQAERRPELILHTSKIARVPYAKAMFSAPVGYKLAKSMRETVAGSSTRNGNAAFQELFDMSFERNKPKNKTK